MVSSTSLLAQRGLARPTKDAAAQNALAQRPQDKVNQFVNSKPEMQRQAMGTGQSTSLLPGNRSVSSQKNMIDLGRNPVQQSSYRRLDTIKQSSDRIRGLYETATQNKLRAKQQAQMQQQQQGGMGMSSGGMGSAWGNDGRLSKSRNSLLNDASSYLGSRYVLGGTSYKGIDCSGLVMMVYNKMGFGISQHSAGWQGRNIPGVRTSIANLRPGDIVAWKDGSHIAIYAGNGQIIEAANERVGTVRRNIWASPNEIYGIAVRLPGE